MHETAERFSGQVEDEYDIKVEVEEFPEGTKTAQEAADAIGCELSQIVKSIVMEADDQTVVVLTSGSNRVSEEKLSEYLDAEEVESADPGTVKNETGWSTGGVPPFCHEEDLEALIDKELFSYDRVWAAAGTHEAVFGINPEKMKNLSEAEIAEVFE